MRSQDLHGWNISPAEARAIQIDLASRVELTDAITLACCRDGRLLPVPTQLAHDTVTRERRLAERTA